MLESMSELCRTQNGTWRSCQSGSPRIGHSLKPPQKRSLAAIPIYNSSRIYDLRLVKVHPLLTVPVGYADNSRFPSVARVQGKYWPGAGGCL